ncbi:hypothetical protein ACFSTI_27385 [Rhizorhabdus histidinilytica]
MSLISPPRPTPKMRARSSRWPEAAAAIAPAVSALTAGRRFSSSAILSLAAAARAA